MQLPATATLLLLVISGSAIAETEVGTSTASPKPVQPIYKPPEPVPGYIPHQTYPYADSYGGSWYDGLGYFYPQMMPVRGHPERTPYNEMSEVEPGTEGALRLILRGLAKFGLFMVGGVALLLIGGIFTTAVCHLTSICVISFPKLGGLDTETMRSLMSPDKIASAAELVQDAIGKYQRLQRAVERH